MSLYDGFTFIQVQIPGSTAVPQAVHVHFPRNTDVRRRSTRQERARKPPRSEKKTPQRSEWQRTLRGFLGFRSSEFRAQLWMKSVCHGVPLLGMEWETLLVHLGDSFLACPLLTSNGTILWCLNARIMILLNYGEQLAPLGIPSRCSVVLQTRYIHNKNLLSWEEGLGSFQTNQHEDDTVRVLFDNLLPSVFSF